MPINSRDKGKRGERDFSKFLTDAGFPARRGAQYAGAGIHQGYDDLTPDIVCKKLDEFHFEVKWVESLNIWKAMEQASHDCGERFPVVAHRRNGTEWLVTMKAEHFLSLIKSKT